MAMIISLEEYVQALTDEEAAFLEDYTRTLTGDEDEVEYLQDLLTERDDRLHGLNYPMARERRLTKEERRQFLIDNDLEPFELDHEYADE